MPTFVVIKTNSSKENLKQAFMATGILVEDLLGRHQHYILTLPPIETLNGVLQLLNDAKITGTVYESDLYGKSL